MSGATRSATLWKQWGPFPLLKIIKLESYNTTDVLAEQKYANATADPNNLPG